MGVLTMFEKTFHAYINSYVKISDHEEKVQFRTRVEDYISWGKDNGYLTDVEYKNYLLLVSELDSGQIHNIKSPRRPKSIYLSYLKGIINFLLIVSLNLVFTIIILYIYRDSSYIQNILQSKKSQYVSTIAYQGMLKSTQGIPIIDKTDLYFRLYKAEKDSSSIYMGECVGADAITPNHEGVFTVILGKQCGMKPIPSQYEQANEQLFLGVIVNKGRELTPRVPVTFRNGDDQPPMTFNNNHPKIQPRVDGQPNGLTLDSEKDTDFTLQALKVFIQTTSAEIGDIIFQPLKNTMFTTGNVYIGNKPATTKLSVNSDSPFESVASFQNDALEDDTKTSVLNLGLATKIKGNKSHFINFFADGLNSRTKVGSIRLKNGGVVYETRGADFAEYFDSEEKNWDEGELVGLNRNGIVHAKIGDAFVGVVSSKAGFVGNSSKSSTGVLVGLKGQIYLKVMSTELIEVSDPLCLSSVEGVAKKCSNAQLHPVAFALSSSDNTKKVACARDSKNTVTSTNIESCTLIFALVD